MVTTGPFKTVFGTWERVLQSTAIQQPCNKSYLCEAYNDYFGDTMLELSWMNSCLTLRQQKLIKQILHSAFELTALGFTCVPNKPVTQLKLLKLGSSSWFTAAQHFEWTIQLRGSEHGALLQFKSSVPNPTWNLTNIFCLYLNATVIWESLNASSQPSHKSNRQSWWTLFSFACPVEMLRS